MDRIFNQFSFIISGLVVLGAGVYLLTRRGLTLTRGLLLAVLLVLLVAAWVILHPSGLRGATADQIRRQIGDGKPVLLEFLSPY